MRFLSAFVVLCILVGLISSIPVYSAEAPPAKAAGAGGEPAAQTSDKQPPSSTGQKPIDDPAKGSTVTKLLAAWDAHPVWKGPLAIAALLGIIGAAVLLYRAGRTTADPHIPKLKPSFFFWLGMIYTGVLLLIATIYLLLPDMPKFLGGILPIAVPWFGALGAVTISLEGVFMWNKQWDEKYNYWHIGRPLFGAVLGIVAFFFYVLLIKASGSEIAFLNDGTKGSEPKDLIIFYMVAFLVGYREETFRELIKRVTDLILKPQTQTALSPIVLFKNTTGATLSEVILQPTPATTSSQLTIEVHNTGDAPLTAPVVKVDATVPTPAGTFGITNDQLTGGGDLAPGQSRKFDLTFAPKVAGNFSGSLTVSGDNLATAKSIRVVGAGT